jgi:S1-C subfamily serine protease
VKTATALSVLILLVSCTATNAQEKSDRDVRQSVVRVFSTIRAPDLLRPWNKMAPQQMMASGVVIDGNRILTNAHLVQYAVQLFVQPYGSGQRAAATVDRVSTEVDLAVLKVSDAAFFKNRLPLEMATTLPEVRDAVTVYGYPLGGGSLSVTKGIVSRIDFDSVDGGGLRIQIDAALNPGNSGGPAIVDDKLAGLVFGMMPQAENIGYAIPIEEIAVFLDETPSQRRGRPLLGDSFQSLENDALRAKLNLPAETTGILVAEPHSLDQSYPLKKGDVITHVGEFALGNDGMVDVRENLRLEFTYVLPKLVTEDKVRLSILRNGAAMPIEVPVIRDPNHVLRELNGAYPSYFVCGPLVFTRASTMHADALRPYLATVWSARQSPMITRRLDRVAFDGEELVMVTTMFPHQITKGYQSPAGQVVGRVNGVPIQNLRQLAETIRDSNDKYIEFSFADRFAETLVFDRKELLAASDDILNDNGIRQACSADLNDVWNVKK